MKILSFLFGILLLSTIIYSGYYTVNHTNFVIWFGLITAVLTPFAIELLLYPIKSGEKKVIEDLKKVAEINALIEKANDKETQVKQLENRLKELDQLIAYESKRRTLETERDIYLFQANNSLKGLRKVQEEMEALVGEKQALPKELKELQEQLEHGEENDIEIPIGEKTIVLRRRNFAGGSIYSLLIFECIRFVYKTFKILDKKLRVPKIPPSDPE